MSSPPSQADHAASLVAHVLESNLRAVRERIRRAALAAGRAAEDVELLPVTKSVSAPVALALARLLAAETPEAARGAGRRVELAENRADELERKAAAFDEAGVPVDWHFVGHLQTNKARRVVRLAAVVHSVDSAHLADTLARVAREEGRRPGVYLQVDFTGEASKSGLDEAGARALVADAGTREGLELLGLMAMGPLEERPGTTTASVFARVAALARALEREHGLTFAGGRCRLSLGMSGDLEQAIAAGSTLVRVGSDLFRGLPQEPRP